MILADSYAGRRVAIFGMARSGLAAAQALVAGGAEIACWDDGERGRAAALAAGLPVVDLTAADWPGFAALILSPGVPLTHPMPHWTVTRAKSANVPVIGDTELFFQSLAKLAKGHRPRVIGITGTNGKSTTTALTAHLLREVGLRVAMGGNIGEAVMGLAPLAETDIYVLELSSYQIDLTPSLACDVGILLNISPDHLDRHGDMAGYAVVKERLVATAATAVVGLDDPWCRAIALRRCRSGQPTIGVHVTVDATRPADAVRSSDLNDFLAAGGLLMRVTPEADILHPVFASDPGDQQVFASLAGIPTLRGAHNAQNAAAAALAANMLFGRDVQAGLRNYPGLAHRMELVGRQGGTLFVNDSKATNADAAAKALNSFADIHWIVGGRPKEGGIEPLAPFFGRVAKAYLIGEAANSFAATLAGQVPTELCGTLDVAVQRAARDASQSATAEPVVLLSPACASFDQFPDFEKRGDAFRTAVQALANLQPLG